MKTLAGFKGIAAGMLAILLGITTVTFVTPSVISGKTFNFASRPVAHLQVDRKDVKTATITTIIQRSCVVVGHEVIEILKKDEDVRAQFFAEFVTDVVLQHAFVDQIIEEYIDEQKTQACVKYRRTDYGEETALARLDT